MLQNRSVVQPFSIIKWYQQGTQTHNHSELTFCLSYFSQWQKHSTTWSYPWSPLKETLELGKLPILERFEDFLSSEDKYKIKINHEPVDEFQRFSGNDIINPLLDFYKSQKENAYVFQNYVLDIYQCRMEALSLVQQPYEVILMDRGLDSCHLFTTLTKHQYTNLGLWCLTDKHQDIKSKFILGKLYASDGVFYLSASPLESVSRISYRWHPGEEQILLPYLKDLDTEYSRYVNSVLSEIPCCTMTTEEDSTEKQLLEYIKMIVKNYDSKWLLWYYMIASIIQKIWNFRHD